LKGKLRRETVKMRSRGEDMTYPDAPVRKVQLAVEVVGAFARLLAGEPARRAESVGHGWLAGWALRACKRTKNIKKVRQTGISWTWMKTAVFLAGRQRCTRIREKSSDTATTGFDY